MAGFTARWQPQEESCWHGVTPDMTAIAKALSVACEIRHAVVRYGSGWRNRDRDTSCFRAVRCCRHHSPAAADYYASARYSARVCDRKGRDRTCWALMLGFGQPAGSGTDLHRSSHDPIALLARSSAKPGRPEKPECWVAHASPECRRDHLELEPEHARARLCVRNLVRPKHTGTDIGRGSPLALRDDDPTSRPALRSRRLALCRWRLDHRCPRQSGEALRVTLLAASDEAR